MRIIYPNPEGGVCVVHPSGEMSIADVARKDVPAGLPYRVIEDAEVAPRAEWSPSFDHPDGYGEGAPA